MSETRKLAAILVAEGVGYSRLASADEERTLARLRGLRSDLFDPAIAAHHGRIVKRTGDGSIIEFRSVVDAVRCAIEVQSGLIERNAGVPTEQRIEFRIGIHVGDVVEESDGDLMGDGVNIAARLEGIANPGAICLSEDAYRHVKQRLDLKVADLGPQNLKNIGEPVRAYLLRQDAQAPAKLARVAASGRRSTHALVAAVAIVLIAVGAYGWRSGLAPRVLGASVAEDKRKTAPRLSIVVLPFQSPSGDLEQERFAEAITDDLTTDLSRLADSHVVSRGTAQTYKDKRIDVQTIGRELGVRYRSEGSVRRSGDKVDVNTQLISTETGAHLWADRFDGDGSNIAARLARPLEHELVGEESLRSLRERPDNPDALDLRLRGEALLWAPDANVSTLREAVGLLDHANLLNPRDARAMRPNDTWAHWTKGYIFSMRGQWTSALREAEQAIDDDRGNPMAYAYAGYWKMHLGRSAEGVADVETALRLSPRDPKAPAWQSYLCFLHAHLAQWDRAIEVCNKAVAANPSREGPLSDLAAAYAWAGRDRSEEHTSELQSPLKL